jgi:hypothetical protein
MIFGDVIAWLAWCTLTTWLMMQRFEDWEITDDPESPRK